MSPVAGNAWGIAGCLGSLPRMLTNLHVHVGGAYPLAFTQQGHLKSLPGDSCKACDEAVQLITLPTLNP